MIPYVNSSFGIRILGRVHGSALYKSILPALISTIIYVAIAFSFNEIDHEIFIHPYPMQALVTAFTFLLVFRANYSYNRWWEAYTAVYLMHSKWLDLATEIAAFHYQSKRYDDYKPPSFGANPDVQSLQNPQSLSNIARPINESGGRKLPSVGIHGAEENVVGFTPSHKSEKDDILTSSSTPNKQNRVLMTPNSRVRHTRTKTLTDLMEQMDEAEAEQMFQQSQITENLKGIDNSYDGSQDDDGVLNPLQTNVDQIDFEKGEGSKDAFEGKKLSWFRKLKDKHSQSKAERKTKRLEKRLNQANALPINVEKITNISRDSTGVNSSRRQLIHQGERKKKRRRSRHINVDVQPATAHLFNQRKSIARRAESTFERSLDFRDRFDVKSGKKYSLFTAVSRKHLRDGHLDPDAVPPMLFLEECAHLLSLMSAVAFSTLRNDLPEAESPLTVFEPGLPWPLVDPDGYKAKVRKGWTQSRSRLYSALQFALGRSRTDHARTLYNAARPFRVIGNVSDAEIEKLQEARGPLAKVSLISMWLLELISREYQAGSTGAVAPPIISRLYQFVSEGLAGYNQARKIAYIPFPFPHAQITTLFLLVVDFFVAPLLMSTFVTDIKLGVILNLWSVLCFTGLHEVAREIENPFKNVPNDVPLNNYQAQFNEGLMVMFYGYHPDAYWIKQQESNIDSHVIDPQDRDQNDRETRRTSVSAANEIHSPHVRFQSPTQYNRKTVTITDDGKHLVDTASVESNLRTTMSEPLQNVPNAILSIVNELGTKASESVPVPIPQNNHDKGFESNQTDEIGSTSRIPSAKSGIINNPIGDIPTDDFLRNLRDGRLDSFSSLGSSFHKASEVDSVRRLSDDNRDPRSSPVLFRIPRLISNLTVETDNASENSNSSDAFAREITEESGLVDRTKKSD